MQSMAQSEIRRALDVVRSQLNIDQRRTELRVLEWRQTSPATMAVCVDLGKAAYVWVTLNDDGTSELHLPGQA